MESIEEKICVAKGQNIADLVLKNAFIINVYTQTIDSGDIAISGDRIVGIGNYTGTKEIDCKGLYVAPGFIDSHVHIESSMVTPEVFSHIVINKGVTTVIADPHEIANVLGKKGINFMLENSIKGTIDTYYMLPSCVPAVFFEDNGATLTSRDLSEFINNERVLGLGEVMDVNSVTNSNKEMIDKINLSLSNKKLIDGHCPVTYGKELNAYIAAGIMTDHECTDKSEALEKVKAGMYVMIREGTAAHDLKSLIGAVNNDNYQRFLFCTDDRHIEDLMEIGSIDNCIRLAIGEGLNPIKAYTIATLNASICYRLYDRGAIAPNKRADLVIFADLRELNIQKVLKNGLVYEKTDEYSKILANNSINLEKVNGDHFKVHSESSFINVIKAIPFSLKTEKVIRRAVQNNGIIDSVIEKDGVINKISVFERHKKTGRHFSGFIEGIGIKRGAIALSISHDSHNVITIGSNDKDMAMAVNTLIDISGGIVVVSDGKILEVLSLPIGGLMVSDNPRVLLEKLKRLTNFARALGVSDDVDPFVTLSFMALPVIPDIKITPRGLFNYTNFSFINISENRGNDMDFYQKEKLDEVLEILKTKDVKVLAGGTDLLLELRRGELKTDCIVDLGRVRELKKITETENEVILGSMTTFSMLLTNPIIKNNFLSLYQCAKTMGSPQIRNMATIGGNIINSSPAADIVPSLESLEAVLEFRNKDNSRYVSIEEYFSDYALLRIKPDELLVNIIIPKRNQRTGFYKLGKRNSLSIARLSAAIAVNLKDDIVLSLRVALGAVGRFPFRVKALEEVSIGKTIDYLYSDEALSILENEVYKSIKGRKTCSFKKEAVKGVFKIILNSLIDGGEVNGSSNN